MFVHSSRHYPSLPLSSELFDDNDRYASRSYRTPRRERFDFYTSRQQPFSEILQPRRPVYFTGPFSVTLDNRRPASLFV
ncbi:unnamed protein product [Didymodactylos carnosus]|uniref:Uncharacterized protein n=1 Tax=Didymodactylos carnosus TaxID=1234261 RepID=A0A813V2A1_9BILA|nr:unnamed protein product [Didymodactylos carnosus]CAF3622858.1 unnamed protein product [Didymodactylos carnosus]